MRSLCSSLCCISAENASCACQEMKSEINMTLSISDSYCSIISGSTTPFVELSWVLCLGALRFKSRKLKMLFKMLFMLVAQKLLVT